MYCCSKLREKRGAKKFSGSPWGKRETGHLKQESETETKMVLGAKNLRIAMVREQWVHGEKNLVREFSGPWVAPTHSKCSFPIPPGTQLPMHSGKLSKDGYINTKSKPNHLKLLLQPKSKPTIQMTQPITSQYRTHTSDVLVLPRVRLT